MDNKRYMICSFDISKLKNKIGNFDSRIILRAIFNPKAVFPMEGRPAMITKSDFWKLLQSEFKQIRRSQLLTKKVMNSIKEVEPDESDEAERSSNKSS